MYRVGVDDIRSLGYTCTDEEGMEVLDAVKNNRDANQRSIGMF